jgi:hypothetical protein
MCVSKEEVACLMTPLRHQDPQIRCLALAFIPHLVQDGDERVLTPIFVLLSCDQSPLVRAAAAAAIGHMCPYGHQLSGQAVTALIKAISQADQHPSVTANSCEALQHIATPKDTTAWKAIAAWHQRQEAEEERTRAPLTADEIARIRSLSLFAILSSVTAKVCRSAFWFIRVSRSILLSRQAGMHAHVSCARIVPCVVFRTRRDISVFFVDSHCPTREMPDHSRVSGPLCLSFGCLDHRAQRILDLSLDIDRD